MAHREQVVDHQSTPNRVDLSREDSDYIAEQLSTALQRGRDGSRLGSHLLKRLRRSRAILAGAIEESENPSPEKILIYTGKQEKKKGWLHLLTGWIR